MFVSGDKVVLVDDKWPAFIVWYDEIPIKNKAYTVRDVRMARADVIDPETAEVAITLNECKNGPDPAFPELVELAFMATRFRKIDEIREERAMSNKKSEPVQGTFF
jgi:hypothetical protein